MTANIEISGRNKKGNRFVFYRTMRLYEGIAADLHDKYTKAGCTGLSIRII